MTRISLDLDTTTAGLQSSLERGVRDGFDVQVWLLAEPSQSYDFAEFHLDFDRSILRVASITNRSGDRLPNQLLPPSFDNQAGEIDFAQGAAAPLPSGDMLLATITFRVVGDGTAALTLTDTFPRESIVTFDRANILDGLDGGTLTAIADKPFIEGGTGNDRLIGDASDNTIHGRAGTDTIEGRQGDDLLFGNAGADRLSGQKGIDEIFGGLGADILNGGSNADRLVGGQGADRLAGNAGKDRLFGGNGDDALIGGLGDDILTGGAKADTFVFLGRFGFDRVTDFTIGVDILDLDASLAFADLTIEQRGQNTRIDIGDDTILLRNIDADTLTEQSFDF